MYPKPPEFQIVSPDPNLIEMVKIAMEQNGEIIKINQEIVRYISRPMVSIAGGSDRD